ncbi:MAG TPA: hypothetical protein VJK29_22410 [Terriglobales bacterium]|nr:hypothetical protein [Terriglobales bacterium]
MTSAKRWGFPVSRAAVVNFVHALVAVLAGNAAYFLLMPYLPPGAKHAPFRMDLGLVVDLWFCLVVFGVIKTATGWRRKSKLQE